MQKKSETENPQGYDLNAGLEDTQDPSASEPADLDASELVGPTGDVEARSDPATTSRWKVSPHFNFRAVFDDNIYVQPKNPTADTIFYLSPGVTLGLFNFEERLLKFQQKDRPATELSRTTGNFVLLDYTPTLVRFAHHSAEDTINESALFDSQWEFSKLTIGALLSHVKDTSVDINVGARVKKWEDTAELRASYVLSEKTSLDSTLDYVTDRYVNYQNSKQFRAENWFRYQATPLIQTGLGFIIGQINIEQTQPQSFQQLLADVSYDATGKLSLHANAGMDFRQFNNSVGNRNTPVFGLGASYTPCEGTLIKLDAYRTVKSSGVLVGENYTMTGMSASIRHAIFSKAFLFTEAGFYVSSFDATTTTPSPPRTDHYYYVKPGILYNVSEWCNLGVYYQYQRNNSTQPSSAFTDNQLTFEASFVF
ncbi:MAG: hypothetical protein WCP06_10805 [Verrucomicrobiota bacterium]